MKHSRIVIILALILLLGSCAGRQASRALDRIALLADSEPDSALALLDSLTPHLGNSEALRARHTVLSAYAKLKIDNEMPDRDTMEQVAEHFFANSTPPTRHHALAFYLLGMAREADSLYAPSLVAYTRAEQVATAIGYHHLLGLIYRCMADVYDDVYNSKEAVHYSELSLKEFQKGSPQPFVDYAMLDLALQYNKILNYPQSLLYADSVIARAYSSGDISLFDVSYRLVGCIAMAESRWEDAIDAYLRVVEITDSLDISSAENLATAFINVGKLDQAKYYLDRFVPHSPEYSHAYSNYNIVTGNYVAAIKGIQQDVIEQDRVIRAVLVQNVSSSVRESFEHETMMLDQKVRINRTLWISISVIALLTIALLVFVHRSRIYRKEKQAAEALAMAQELTLRLNEANRACRDTSERLDSTSQLLSETSQLLTEKSSALRDTAGSLQAIFQSRLDSLEALCDTLYEFSGTDRQQRDLHGKAMALILEFGQNPDSIRAIRAILNQTNDRVMEKFTADFPQIKDELTMLFTYMVLGLSSRAISVLMKTDINRVYRLRYALKKLILASDSPRRDLYLKFMARNA